MLSKGSLCARSRPWALDDAEENGSDLHRILFRDRALSGGDRESISAGYIGGLKASCRDGGAKSMLISGGSIASMAGDNGAKEMWISGTGSCSILACDCAIAIRCGGTGDV